MVDDLRTASELERHVAAVPEVVAEVVLDALPFVAQAENEVFEAVLRVGLHDVPDDGLPADGHHGLWDGIRSPREDGSPGHRKE
jgi:hypothetical protein